MRRILVLIIFLVFLNLLIIHNAQPIGLIALYADSNRSACCVYGNPMYSFDLWVWCNPSENGQIGVEFAIGYPAGIFSGPFTINDNLVSEAIGDLESGIRITYNEYQYDWNWPLHQEILVFTYDWLIFEVVAHSGIPFPRLFNCEEGNPAEQCCMCNFYVNECPM